MIMGGDSTIGMLRGIFVNEGVSGLHRGVTAPLLAVTPAFAIAFWSFDLASRAIRGYSHLPPDEELTIALFREFLLRLFLGPPNASSA
jgi:hypothetical protein